MTTKPRRPYTGRTAARPVNQTGSGRHLDRRTRRVRTRAAAKARALQEQAS